MSFVTRILSQINDGDPKAAPNSCCPSFTRNCGSCRCENGPGTAPGRRCRPPALVLEAYIRLVDDDNARRLETVEGISLRRLPRHAPNSGGQTLDRRTA